MFPCLPVKMRFREHLCGFELVEKGAKGRILWSLILARAQSCLLFIGF
jgi:hypothetical protein